jgi:hypothetical protein
MFASEIELYVKCDGNLDSFYERESLSFTSRKDNTVRMCVNTVLRRISGRRGES